MILVVKKGTVMNKKNISMLLHGAAAYNAMTSDTLGKAVKKTAIFSGAVLAVEALGSAQNEDVTEEIKNFILRSHTLSVLMVYLQGTELTESGVNAIVQTYYESAKQLGLSDIESIEDMAEAARILLMQTPTEIESTLEDLALNIKNQPNQDNANIMMDALVDFVETVVQVDGVQINDRQLELIGILRSVKDMPFPDTGIVKLAKGAWKLGFGFVAISLILGIPIMAMMLGGSDWAEYFDSAFLGYSAGIGASILWLGGVFGVTKLVSTISETRETNFNTAYEVFGWLGIVVLVGGKMFGGS